MWAHTFQIILLGILTISTALAETKVTDVDLQHHRWVLESINGEALPSVESGGKIPELDFGEQMTVTGNTGCNQLSGKGVLRGGFFLIEAMASTQRLCSPEWNDIERKLQTVLGAGSTISLGTDKNLTLKTTGVILTFRLQDWVN
jgi:heat shock protein HslJ